MMDSTDDGSCIVPDFPRRSLQVGKKFYLYYYDCSVDKEEIVRMLRMKYSEAGLCYVVATYESSPYTVYAIVKFCHCKAMDRMDNPFGYDDSVICSFAAADRGVKEIDRYLRVKSDICLYGISYLELAWKLIPSDIAFLLKIMTNDADRMFIARLFKERYRDTWRFQELMINGFDVLVCSERIAVGR